MNFRGLLAVLSACSFLAPPVFAQAECPSGGCTVSETTIEPPLPCAAIGYSVLEDDCGCFLFLGVDNQCEMAIEASGFIFNWCDPAGRTIEDCGSIPAHARGEEFIDIPEPGKHEITREVTVDGTVHTLSTTVDFPSSDDDSGCGCSLGPRSGSNLLALLAVLLAAAVRRRVR